MDFTGNLKGIQTDWVSGETIISFSVNEKSALADVDKLKDKKLSINAVQFREKRSLSANAYYWQLISKLAEAVGTSKPFMHNKMLRRYGQDEIMEGKAIVVFIPDTDEAENDAMEAETFHIKPTSKTEVRENGVRYRLYKLLKGSSEYNSYEMSKLIDGLVTECKENGIETLPPDQLKEMIERWGK